MRDQLTGHPAAALGVVVALLALSLASPALAQYRPIQATLSDHTVPLTGHDLTVDQVAQIARYGAKVQLTQEARQRNADIWGLMMEAATEGVPVYLFNRGAGGRREIPTFSGDPFSPQNLADFRRQGTIGTLPPFQAPAQSAPPPRNGAYNAEINDEDIARAIMVVRANQMIYMPNSPAVLQALVDLLNADITPVIRQRGGVGEANDPAANNISTVIRGGGEAYYHGVRMSAVEALAKAGLKPTPFAPGDSTTFTVNADVSGMAALLVYDARRFMEWCDLVLAVDMEGLNSNTTRLFPAVQANRPFKWLNWQAARVLDMLKGSYLFNHDLKRIIQDSESMEGSPELHGSTWQMWAALRDDVTTQINYSDHNPSIHVGLSPADSWELSTPQAMRYYVKGGPQSHGQHGYILSNTNWSPWPLGDHIEAFTIALANLDVAIMLRQERFNSPYFTAITAQQILTDAGRGAEATAAPGGGGGGGAAWTNHEVWQRIQGLINPVPPEGYGGGGEQVEELEGETLFKVGRARDAVEESWLLLASDLVTGTRWMDLRKIQDPTRYFGAAPTATWQAFRKVASFRAVGGAGPDNVAALAFITSTPASSFYPGGPVMPRGDN